MNSSPLQEKRKRGGARAGAGRKRREDWQETYLRAYATHGGLYRSAAEAGVTARTVLDEQARNPAFAERLEVARQTYADTLESKLEAAADRTGNPVGYIVLLKALRPQQFVERHMNVSLNVDVEVPAEHARQVLADMLQHLTPATREALTAHQALPALTAGSEQSEPARSEAESAS